MACEASPEAVILVSVPVINVLILYVQQSLDIQNT